MILKELISWFKENKKDYPWRQTSDPYLIWISEIMLQQTVLQTVIPYFYRWIEKFPDVKTLSSSSLESVIKAWEGLGYYSRARHIWESAKYICTHFNGQMPSNEEDLKKLKGIGPYTRGAILSFAFHQKKAAVDGNVLRVMSRLALYKDDISKSSSKADIEALVQSWLPDKEPWIAMEALIELGQTICKKTPSCLQCPLKTKCRAFLEGEEKNLPYSPKKVAITKIERTPALILHNDFILLKKNHAKLMKDLWEFPFFEGKHAPDSIQKNLPLHLHFVKALAPVSHGFTRFKATLYPLLFTAQSKTELADCQWIHKNDISNLPFSSGHRKILKETIF